MDETQPLLPDADSDQLPKVHGANVIDFDPNGDAENPQEWPRAYKWGIVALLASTAFTVTFTCIGIVPVANRIVRDLNHGESSKSSSVLLVTIWELGEAAGPLLIAPLSELYGRYPVMNAANVLFISATILAALCQSTPLFIAARALTGLAVASNVLSPAIVGDMFISEQRGSAMSYIMLAPLLGGAVGPAIAGAVAQSLGWRQVLWMSAILAGLCEVLFLFCSRETYKVAILRRRAARLREETGNKALRTAYDDENERKLWNSIMRPVVVFCDSMVLQMLAIYGSLAFSYFYVMSTTLPDILEGVYHLSPALTGSSFICFSIGSTVSLVIVNLLLDRIYIKLRDAHKGIEQPEHRLPLVIVGAFSMPFVIALYGWVPALGLPLQLMLICLGFLGATMLLAFMPLMAYVVDAFKLYSASALTALIVVRCLVGTFLPLITEPLIKSLGYGWGFTVLCAASLCVAPIPVLVFRYGARWRQRSTYTKEE